MNVEQGKDLPVSRKARTLFLAVLAVLVVLYTTTVPFKAFAEEADATPEIEMQLDEAIETEESTESIESIEVTEATEESEGNEVAEVEVAEAEEQDEVAEESEAQEGVLFEGSQQTVFAITPIDAATFPDANFRTYVSANLDLDMSGSLEDGEIDAVTILDVSRRSISDLTGISVFYKLEILDCSSNNLSSLDVSRNTELIYLDCSYNYLSSLDVTQNTKLLEIYYSSNNLTTLDFRNNKDLQIGHHATNGETVYISAGMLDFIGCHAIPSHTGNIVIDLEGFYTEMSDGTKVADLTQVISTVLIDQITEGDSSVYDSSAYTITFPVGERTVVITAKNGNVYTFHVDLGLLGVHAVTYVSEGAVYGETKVNTGNAATKITPDPTRSGYAFTGWYVDQACTTVYDFSTLVTADITLYAGWQEVEVVEETEETEEIPTVISTKASATPQTGDTFWHVVIAGILMLAASGFLTAKTLSGRSRKQNL